MFTLRLRVFLIAIIFSFIQLHAQVAPERSTPFTAVKWIQYNPYVMIDGEWYLLVLVNNTAANKIVDYCKQNKPSQWQKFFSEDFVEAMKGIGAPLQTNVKLTLIKDGKTIEKTLEMTTDNRRKVRDYNTANPTSTAGKSQEQVVKDVQKDIAETVNIKNDNVYKFKSAKIEYTTTGHKLYAGTETMYIDSFGKTIILITDKPNKTGGAEKTTIIWRNNETIFIDHVKKTYYTTKVRTKSTEPPTIAYSTPEQIKQGGYEKKPNEMIATKDCEVYEGKNKATYYLWKGIDLKLKNYTLGNTFYYVREATLVEENIVIPAALFIIPEGYRRQ